MKQTVVEWLIDQWPVLESQLPSWLIEQAKEMEKEQLKNAYLHDMTGGSPYGFEQYYNETFKSDETASI